MSRSGPEAPTFRQEYPPLTPIHIYIYILYHIQLVDSYTLTLLVARLSSWLNDGLEPGVVAVWDVPVGGAAYDAAGTLVGMSVAPTADDDSPFNPHPHACRILFLLRLGLSPLPRCSQRFAPSIAEALEVSQ